MRQNWKPLWKTDWKCPFRVYVLLLTDTRKPSKSPLLNCYMGHELRTAKDNGHLSVTPAVFLPCAESMLLTLVGDVHVSFNSLPVPSWMLLEANTLQSWRDFFYAVCAFALILQLLWNPLSANCRSWKAPPILLAHLQLTHICIPGTFLSTPPSLQLPEPCTQKTSLFHSNFLHASVKAHIPPHSTDSPKIAVSLRWSGLNTSWESSQFELSIAPRKQSGSDGKG